MNTTGKYSFGRFIKYLLIVSVAVAALGYYPVSLYASKDQIYSFIPGFLISFINALIGYKLSLMAFGRSVKSFMILVFGGMGIRLLIVIIFLLILIQFTGFDSLSLAGSVFFFYTVFITLEIFFLHRLSSESDKNKIQNKV
jgi:hypothetical protein